MGLYGGPGRAPEILQSAIGAPPPEAPAPVIQQPMHQSAAAAASVAPPPPPPTVSAASEVPAESQDAAEKPQDPATVALEQYPDEDLQKLAADKGIRVDGRWGRERLIAEILSAPEPAPAPTPSATVVPPAPPPAPPVQE